MLLKLRIELEDIQSEISTVSQRISNVMLKKAETLVLAGEREFINYFEKLNFIISNEVSQTRFDGSYYPVKIIKANYRNIQYTLSIPDIRIAYLGALTVLTLSDNNSEINIGVSSENSGFRSETFTLPNNEEDRLNAEIERERKKLERTINRETNLNDEKVVYTVKNDNAKYNDFTEILEKYVK
ncbi:hypothetical protein BSK59_16300 [Paenibacillus odorifer]|uniref:hypothetical protein n=1 Tax=Paenibacillus odorifer TaxID=189426 RepID=UPI00096C523F|nr:hypothetical protein [Paenibacillus odorifer]OME54140.1 hypothetical protein BSK59_16300 [Paenibacillus odorifer]